jgi:hypothetical protein
MFEWVRRDPEPTRLGEISIDDPRKQRTRMRPRRPNLSAVRARVVQRFAGPGNVPPEGFVWCYDDAVVSVPQYFWVHFLTGIAESQLPGSSPITGDFFVDLERVGLRRRPASTPGAFLTDRQVATNSDVANAVIDTSLQTARSLLSKVNVRFTETDPTALVGFENFSEIKVGGRIPGLTDFGTTLPPTDPTRNRGMFDVGNLEPRQEMFIFSAWIAGGGAAAQTSGDAYDAIFRDLAVEGLEGLPLGGTPVDAGDFARRPTSVRQRTVRAAIIAVGTMIGQGIAHECGHALGLPHNDPPADEIMDEGEFDTFEKVTGISDFDPMTGAFRKHAPTGFGATNLRKLTEILPIL